MEPTGAARAAASREPAGAARAAASREAAGTAASDFTRASRRRPGPRDWILDLYGSFVRDFGGWIAVSDLLTLLGEIGVSRASGRSAVSRMKRRRELRAVSHGPVRGYSLTEAADRWFADGTARIMDRFPGTANGTGDGLWAVASFTVPEEDRRIRYRIRSRLQGLGFGQLSGGLMIAPARILDESARALKQAGLSDYVDIWQARHVGSRPLRHIVNRAWDLRAIDSAYREYIALASALRDEPEPVDDAETFIRYLVHVNAWRELPFMDPGIPADCLPADWPAEQARATFGELAARWRPGAWRHFVQTVSTHER